MKMTENIRGNLLTIKGLTDDLSNMTTEDEGYYDFVYRMVDTKLEVIREICGETLPEVVTNYILNNFYHFIKEVFLKKDLVDII